MPTQGRSLDHHHTPESLPTFHEADVITFADQAVAPDATGELQRNGTALGFYDGTAARYLGLVTAAGDVPMGFCVEAVSASEATTTSTVTVNLKTITVSIGVGQGALILCNMRKSAGFAASASIGLDVNGSAVRTPVVWSSAVDQAESGTALWVLWRRSTNYTGTGFQWTVDAGQLATFDFFSAVLPVAAITSINIQGLVGNAAVTMGVADAVVYKLLTDTF